MKTKKTTKKPPVPAKRDTHGKALASSVLEEDAGQGMELADRDSYALPFLVVLQKNSPQCDEDNASHIPGAKAGMFLNTATQELFHGDVVLVPAHFSRRFVEWVPRDQGGGYRGDHAPDSVNLSELDRDESGRFVTENGNHLIDTRYHFCVHLTENGPVAVVVALSSTQIKKSRLWMTMMANIKLDGRDGRRFTPPTYSHAYSLTTVTESNDKGSWKGVTVRMDHILTSGESVVYAFAKELREQIRSGAAKVEQPNVEEHTEEF